MSDVLARIRESKRRLAKINKEQRAELATRKRLFTEARKEGIALRHVAHAAGISEGAVSLAMRVDRDVPMREEKQ